MRCSAKLNISFIHFTDVLIYRENCVKNRKARKEYSLWDNKNFISRKSNQRNWLFSFLEGHNSGFHLAIYFSCFLHLTQFFSFLTWFFPSLRLYLKCNNLMCDVLVPSACTLLVFKYLKNFSYFLRTLHRISH